MSAQRLHLVYILTNASPTTPCRFLPTGYCTGLVTRHEFWYIHCWTSTAWFLVCILTPNTLCLISTSLHLWLPLQLQEKFYNIWRFGMRRTISRPRTTWKYLPHHEDIINFTRQAFPEILSLTISQPLYTGCRTSPSLTDFVWGYRSFISISRGVGQWLLHGTDTQWMNGCSISDTLIFKEISFGEK